MLEASLESQLSTSFGPDLRVLDGIASWCGALHESMELDAALGTLSNAVSAEVAVVSREVRADGKLRIVAKFDVKVGDRKIDQLRRAFSHDVLGRYLQKMRSGSAWFLSDHEDEVGYEITDALSAWRISRGIVDIVVFNLQSSGLQRDFLEFHFTQDLSRSDKHAMESLLPVLVRSWAGRRAGLVTQARIDERIVRARAAAKANKIKPDVPLLGMSNPAKLSRAEFRVCLLLSRGLSTKGVMHELGLSEATVRSHLRSIYSKTETSGLAELVYRLLSSQTSMGGRSLAATIDKF